VQGTGIFAHYVIILSAINKSRINKKYRSSSIEYFLKDFSSALVLISAENFHIRNTEAKRRIPMI
jgi:hypothetical protein